MNKPRSPKFILIASLLAASLAALPFSASAADGTGAATVELRILETTDLHVNIVNYDYFADKPTDEYGLAKTATLIKQARAEAKNSLLIDNGDLIQGNPLGDYVATVDKLQEGETHPVYKAMNLLGYDAGNFGNHEFNYGLDFLKTAVKGSDFPYVNANIYLDDKDQDPSNDKNAFTPYLILDKEVTDSTGAKHKLKVGIIGFVPPQIMSWDKAHLEGKLITKDIVETAKKFVPQMKKEGADLIIAVPHSGFEDIPQTPLMENSVLYLSKVEGIDAILFGHAHKVFPDASFEGKTGVDLSKGTINGVPAVEPGYWGNNLGIIDLTLEKSGDAWTVKNSKVAVKPIYDTANKKPLVDADPAIWDAIQEDHEHTLEYVRGPVGKTSAPINSWFALIQDDPSIQIVTNAQKWYVEKHLQGTEYEGVPVLSAGAPFKAGGRQGANYYTNIPAGDIAIKNVADLYLYSNTVNAVLVTGAELKEWLEWSAGQFNQIDPAKTEAQELVNYDFPTYNFDVIDGVTYQIDVTKPAKYDAKGGVLNEKSSRIVNLSYNGKPIDPAQKFVVASNNYRASSSKFANPDGKRIILASPDENRQVIIDYIRENGTINPTADGNWSLAPFGKANVTFATSPAAKETAAKARNLKYLADTKDGYSTFQLSSTAESANPTPTPAPAPAPAPVPTPEPSPAPAPAPAAGTDTVYIVKKGDTLYDIALEHGTTWQALAKYNKLSNPHLIRIGQKILIPVQ
ncbi:bifunctional 2',3'-cyclic-nucleotide 2'-phosphodiesterase/3'-nucleotidase [Paenibacillus sp. MBLB2552]|uniref:Bifunctional 2',3'-cyclic-nucleotide 2'-phosphodiesterase/3'-nucleotidase n=1 Tax=Paenibacillus mellifer TaxID=2937794 RepID=A0A9X2BNT4_9BACL|nr:bifunctional 2',3'-cyclic-nucleotide 2'-phosphodiesterase/3'-nucleotidase [Paenibacillus mellifer]MCK8486572.1 bifunctional 2',3'-cyclic-nucleotide 2'-phosphodiesterase/3'-nucleotidase [Paenibacillus mellifer]